MGLFRIILAISVVMGHAGFSFSVGGLMAVQTFYIISGFYMALILTEKYTGKNNSYKLFITNRFLRLYPMYWAVLILTIIVSIFYITYSHGQSFGKLEMYREYFNEMKAGSFIFLVFTNIGIFFQDTVMFLGLNAETGNLFFTSNFGATLPALHQFLLIPQAWSIGVELLFYLTIPFLIKKRTKTLMLFCCASFSIRLIIYFVFGFRNDPWTYRFFPNEIMFFLSGVIAYRVYKHFANNQERILGYKVDRWAMAAMGAVVLIISIMYSYIPIKNHIKYCLYYVVVFISLPFIFFLTKEWKWDRYVGELSYPVYISHMLIIYSISGRVPVLGNMGITATICTVVMAVLLNEIIGKNIEKIRQRRIKLTK
jgi:peptidoglycan/LPS O-acetylase OafA/YrhL